MVTVVAQSQFKKERLDEVLAIYQGLVFQTRKEPGCRRYELFQNQADPTRLTMIEEWEDDAALQTHLTSPGFHALVGQLKAFASAPSELARYTQVL